MDVETDEEASRVQPTPLCCSTRLGLSVIGFFMFFHLYAQRVGMSVAIVSMVNQTAVTSRNSLIIFKTEYNVTYGVRILSEFSCSCIGLFVYAVIISADLYGL